jgi:hypothetical protein
MLVLLAFFTFSVPKTDFERLILFYKCLISSELFQVFFKGGYNFFLLLTV